MSRFAVGVCVQTPSYDLRRLERGVHYAENAINIESTSLPVPDVVRLVSGSL